MLLIIIEEFVKFKGVGRKIVNVIMVNIYGIFFIIVDIYCKRFLNRFGFVNSKDVIKIEFELKKIVEF